ncbi:MAG: hypothetical protein ACHQ2Y_05135 [Candidatus Lutacidiplasmatales archaeon]
MVTAQNANALRSLQSEFSGGQYHLYPRRLRSWHIAFERTKLKIARLKEPWEGILSLAIVVALYISALFGAYIAAGGSALGATVGVPLIVVSAVFAAHFAPKRPFD